MLDIYEAIIGLEVHVELATSSKIFCSCKNTLEGAPNSAVCPICMGLPGSMPTFNRRALELAVRAGLVLECSIADKTRFDRKNYFYPDLPKAYQISQNEYPICRDGKICIGGRSIGIERIHMEEDAGKLVHDGERGTLVDYNRCGVPLIEIVTRPDIRTAEEARAFLGELRLRLIYAGVSECKMQYGQLRCDVNLSVRKKGERDFGVRTEIKNINSFAFVGKAIEYEFARQVSVLESGVKILMQTMRFDADMGRTLPMRTKESAADYRFFPEPDLPELSVGREYVEKIRAALPPMPSERIRRYVEDYGLRRDDAEIIVARLPLAEYFEAAAELTEYKKAAANIILTELLGTQAADTFECALPPEFVAQTATLYGNRTINSSTVKRVLAAAERSGASPIKIVEENGLAQISDRAYISEVLRGVLRENPKLLGDFRSGKTAAQKAIFGKVMALTSGRADPILLGEIWEAERDKIDI